MFKLTPRTYAISAIVAAAGVAVFVKFALAIVAFVPGEQPTGYIAQDEITNYNLTSGNETLYRGDYKKEFYSGNLFAFPVDAEGDVNLAAEWWSGGAAVHIDAQDHNTGRRIATMKDDGNKVPFRWVYLSSTQQGYLTDSAVVDFLRGDRSGEVQNGGSFRQRASALGDIVHSRPYYVADATNPTVFVGANDGMLHAIDAAPATGGAERWAYVPSMLIPKLKNLSVNPYVRDYFVDGSVNVATILSGTKRILVGTLGAGGRGLYALDITGSAGLAAASESGVASKILWEITPTKVNYQDPATANAYRNLGYTYSTPTIAKVLVAGVATDAVIIGNGYNNATTGDSDQYQAFLFVINAGTGQLISKIKAGTSGTVSSPNGLSTPVAVDTDGDGNVDVVYAGDLNGTMWKFVLSSASATALLTTSPAQPISMTPAVGLHPNGGYMVNFATGRMFTEADISDETTIYYAYGVWDGAPVGNTTLVAQILTERSYTHNGVTARVRRVTANAPNWASGGHRGWRVALQNCGLTGQPTCAAGKTGGGERVIGDGSFLENGRFYFSTHNPTLSSVIPDTTTTVYGENWLMELDYLSGGTGNRPFLDMNSDLLLNDSDRINYISGDVIPTGSAVGSPILTTDGIPVGKFLSSGVMSQPILVQLKTLNDTLFNSNPDITVPAPPTDQGVAGGHFDQDVYYGSSSGVKASATVSFTYAGDNTAKDVSALTIVANGETLYSGAPGSKKPKDLDDMLNNVSSANYRITKNAGDNHTIKIEAKTAGTTFNGTVSVTITTTGTSPGYTKTDLAGGTEPTMGDNCTDCSTKNHVHQYDDKYDVTGVNFLNASNTVHNLANAVTSTSTAFKVIAHNQYLNPAVELHIGDPTYQYNIDAGYIQLKNYVTSAGLDLATLPTYTRANVGSFAINMPVDALTAKDWWGNGDVRAGLHPTQTGCVKQSDNTTDGNMYQPVVPPANGTDGPGTKGWSASTTPATATGARHNGALVIQVISASTPNSAIEENIAGRPEYGWRVKSASYSTYVFAEYTTFWHHPNGKCYSAAGWTKNPGPDDGSSELQTKAPGSTDPKIGDLSAGGTVVSSNTVVSGNVTTTTVTYSSGTVVVITRTVNPNGTITIVTETTTGGVTTTTTEVIANTEGTVRSGGDERGLQARTGRVAWRELVRP